MTRDYYQSHGALVSSARLGLLALAAMAIVSCQSGTLDTYRKPINSPAAALQDQGTDESMVVATQDSSAEVEAGDDTNVGSKDEDRGETSATAWNYDLNDLEPAQKPASGTVEGGIWYNAEKSEHQIARSGKRIRNGPLPSYIEGIVCKIAGPYCGDIRTYIVRTPGFNASMSANGTMTVQTGFLLRVRSEAQLAAVIGHEIGHYLRRHTLKSLSKRVAGNIAATWAGILLGVNLSNEMQASLLAYSRDHEREADGYGLLLMSRAGYDPRQATWVWERLLLEMDQDQKSGDKRWNFLSTHPPSVERAKALRILAAEMIEAGKVADDPIDGYVAYQKVLAPYRADFLEDEIAAGNFNHAAKLIDILIGDGQNRAELLFYKGEIYRRRGKKKDPEQAMFSYNRAFRAGTPPPEIHRSIGLIHYKLKEFDAANEHFAKYLNLKPDAKDASIVKSMMGAGT